MTKLKNIPMFEIENGEVYLNTEFAYFFETSLGVPHEILLKWVNERFKVK